MEDTQRVMLGIAGLAYLASLVSEILFNRIVLPGNREPPPWEDFGPAGADIFRRLYRRRRPQVLQRAPLLSILIERGGILFYVVACAVFSAYLYLALESPSWVLVVCLPLYVLAYFITSLLALVLATLLIRETEEDDNQQAPP